MAEGTHHHHIMTATGFITVTIAFIVALILVPLLDRFLPASFQLA